MIDARTKALVGALVNELGAPVRSEKLVEIDFAGDRPVRAGRHVSVGGKR